MDANSTRSTIRRGLAGAAVALVLTAASLATPTAAEAEVSSAAGGVGNNYIQCDGNTNITVRIHMTPEGHPAQMLGTYAQLWLWGTATQTWVGTGWMPVNGALVETAYLPSGTYYAYVFYAFEQYQGGWSYGGEWAGGGRAPGRYFATQDNRAVVPNLSSCMT